MAQSTFLFLLWLGFSLSYPTTKLNPVSVNVYPNDSTRLEVGTTHTDSVELTLPVKIMTKEELITWVTYAMRIMASRINITLAAVDSEETPPEKIEKLRNSSVAINHLLERMNSEEKKRLEGRMPVYAKSTKMMSMSSLKVLKNDLIMILNVVCLGYYVLVKTSGHVLKLYYDLHTSLDLIHTLAGVDPDTRFGGTTHCSKYTFIGYSLSNS